MILKYLSRLSKREKEVFYFAVCVVSLVFLDRVVVAPIFSRIRLLDEKIQGQEELIRKNARILAEKERIEATIKEYDKYSRAPLSPEEETAYLLGEIEKLARKTSLYVIDMKPVGVKEDAVSRTYSVDLNCEAQMEQILAFMHEVEGSTLIFFVESFNISSKSKDSSIAKCNLRISHVIFL